MYIEFESDIDGSAKVDYAKFQGMEEAQEQKKTLKVDLSAKIEKEGEV